MSNQQIQNQQDGEVPPQPQDPQYSLQQHIIFKHTAQTTNKYLRQLIETNLSQFSLIMDGTAYAYVKAGLENKGIQELDDALSIGYPHLRMLELGFNQIKDPSHVQKLKYLTDLNLKRNQIQQISALLQASQDLTYLKRLNLEGNLISALCPIKLRSLVNLNLSNNIISNLSEFQGHQKLQVLELRGNKIKDLKGLSNCSNLRYLYIADNLIEHFDKGLTELPNLTKIHARKNRIQSFISGFPDLPKLQYLNLRQNQIKSIDNLKGVSESVEILNLLGCPLSEQQGDNTGKQIWMIFRHYKKINKVEITAQEKEDFDKEYKERLAEQQRQRLQKEEAEREQKQARQTAEREQRQAKQAAQKQQRQARQAAQRQERQAKQAAERQQRQAKLAEQAAAAAASKSNEQQQSQQANEQGND